MGNIDRSSFSNRQRELEPIHLDARNHTLSKGNAPKRTPWNKCSKLCRIGTNDPDNSASLIITTRRGIVNRAWLGDCRIHHSNKTICAKLPLVVKTNHSVRFQLLPGLLAHPSISSQNSATCLSLITARAVEMASPFDLVFFPMIASKEGNGAGEVPSPYFNRPLMNRSSTSLRP